MPEGSDLVFNRLNAHYKRTRKVLLPEELSEQLRGRCSQKEIIQGVVRFDRHLDAVHAVENQQQAGMKSS